VPSLPLKKLNIFYHNHFAEIGMLEIQKLSFGACASSESQNGTMNQQAKPDQQVKSGVNV
jgi:hypothetical protein